jgi:hypothetical protein
MSTLAALARDLRDDATAWATVQAAHQQVLDARRERHRLQRLLDTVHVEEADALTRLTVALGVIKQRQQGEP